MTWIGSIFSAIGGFFSWLSGRSAAANTPEMRKASGAQKSADTDAKINKVIRDRDTEEARRRLG